MSRVRLLSSAFAIFLCAAPAAAQDSVVAVVPGPQYGTGWFHRLLFGAHYRDLWTTPMAAEWLDLDRFAGGLTVTGRA